MLLITKSTSQKTFAPLTDLQLVLSSVSSSETTAGATMVAGDRDHRAILSLQHTSTDDGQDVSIRILNYNRLGSRRAGQPWYLARF